MNKKLRYGENPHQEAKFHGNLETIFTQLSGKELSYNNLLDVDAAMRLSYDSIKNHFIILKHNNASGFAHNDDAIVSWQNALASDPISAFGGVIITDFNIDLKLAQEMDFLFFEVLLAPSFDEDAIKLLSQKKNRILLKINSFEFPQKQVRSCLNGILEQDIDFAKEDKSMLQHVTDTEASLSEIEDMLIANVIAKHSKSNTIILVKDGRLIGSGVGMTSRVDALKHAISKATEFGFSVAGSVMASDAFFPFPDCVEIAANAGVTAIIQPGGSIKDDLSIDMCNQKNISMVLTGVRHFKH